MNPLAISVFALIVCLIGLALNIKHENTSLVIVMIVCIVFNLVNIGSQIIKLK